MSPRSLVLVALAAMAALLIFRRRRALARERVDLYFADGSMVSLENGAPARERILTLARVALRAARG